MVYVIFYSKIMLRRILYFALFSCCTPTSMCMFIVNFYLSVKGHHVDNLLSSIWSKSYFVILSYFSCLYVSFFGDSMLSSEYVITTLNLTWIIVQTYNFNQTFKVPGHLELQTHPTAAIAWSV